MTGHLIDVCKHCLNAALVASGNMLVFDKAVSSGTGSGQIWCRYCKNQGHLISDCRKRIFNEQKKNNNAIIAASGQQGSSSNNRRCYTCNEVTHIAKDCPKNKKI